MRRHWRANGFDGMAQSETSTDPLVAAIVLNWNGGAETIACLQSLVASDWPRMLLIVVDNASEEDIADAVNASLPGVILVRNDANLGFAGGMNAGLQQALELGAEYALLLNNDTAVDPAMVRVLVETAQREPDVGIVSPLILSREAPDVVSNAGLRFDPRRGYWGQPMGMGERDRGQFRGVRDVDAVSGTAMLVPVAILGEVGMLDEDLYLYIEDVDWSLRMRKAGRRICVASDARIWHGVSRSSGGEYSPLIAYYSTRNRFVVCARHAPLRGPRAVLRHIEILVTNLVHARRGHRPLSNARAVLSGWRDYRAGRLGPRASEAPARASR